MSPSQGVPAAVPDYRILGPLEVGTGATTRLRVAPGRQQVVLGALLLEPNRVVSIAQLVDTVWYEDPPATARTQVQICVSSLRAKLAEAECGATIITRSPGYLLRVEEDRVDHHRFVVLVSEATALTAAAKWAEAAAVLRSADALWRGPALSGIPSRILQVRAGQLDESRLNAVESRFDLELRLGRHHQLVGEVAALLNEHPLRERARGQLMLALHRAGRQSEALRVYRDGRELLVEQFGLEPGDELRRLERAILADDDTLRVVPVGRTVSTRDGAVRIGVRVVDPAESADPAGSDRDTAAPAAATPDRAVPAEVPLQLPGDIADFAGRADLVARTEGLLLAGAGRAATRVVVLLGKPGIGKSALAVHVAHRLPAADFPDGQLYCDLGGTRARAVGPAEVLGRFLRALGVAGSSVPDALDERAEMYRSLLARRRMIVLLDDAAAETQVQNLLPGTSGCVVLITSRARLTGLAGARLVDVEVMDPAQAHRLLTTVVGQERVDAEPVAAAELIEVASGLPLALRILAARLAARPSRSLGWMVRRLVDEHRRLDELAHGDLAVRASVALSYDSLPPDARRLVRRLSVLDVTSFPVWVAAALLDDDSPRTADLLELLVDEQMLEAAEDAGGLRYRFHNLIRLFARERLEATETQGERRRAVSRVADGWLALAGAAHRRVYGGDYAILRGVEPRWVPAPEYLDQVRADPLGWLESERATLCAAVELTAAAGLDETCCELAITLVTLFESGCHFEDWEHTHRRALEVAEAAGNRRGLAVLRCSLASLHLSRGRLSAAQELLEPVLVEFTDLRDVHGQAMARRNLALVDHLRGDLDPALMGYRVALGQFRAAGDPVGQAHVLCQIAQLDLDAEQLPDAEANLLAALEICGRVGSGRVEVQVRYRLSGLLVAQGHFDQADAELAEVLAAVRSTGDVVGEGRVLHRLGTVKALLGRTDEAVAVLTDALALRERTMDLSGAAEIRKELAKLTG
ncbi:BTAD domain-containing putative transcriptional regulator [Actinokineospora sp. NBRC 105648]|uniref:AfsR/SARP family transcriptional regulator n=1 Tax=Actinokineospora sp. NBRC 105648 TaxID=3032206 RepID=UPI0024A511A5|nr:BTAD domain-containing putative transcriptional regulator [Actinokineospora sp. NBRC 105648]GLZ37978.1 SARP family transcriptional regulator [Actinokineospora sp. NBRC 105648]